MQFKLFQMWRVIFSLLALTADPDVWAFPTGAPTSVCDSMFPSHEAGAQGSLSPYELVVNKDTYAGGEEVQVTLKKIGDSWEFKGFFIQARKVDGSTEAHGKFTAVDSFTKTVNCGSAANSENAVTHRSSTSKPSVTVTWTAPSIPVGHIQFRATVVMTENIFWVNVLSALVQDATDLPAGDLASKVSK